MELDDLNYVRWRLLNGLPEGLEISGNIPLEMNLDFLNYISFSKGCYIGQELIARTYFKVSSFVSCHVSLDITILLIQILSFLGSNKKTISSIRMLK